MTILRLRMQEIAFDHPRSSCMFCPSDDKPFVATRAAVDAFGIGMIITGLCILQAHARERSGIHHVQVFDVHESDEPLWFIEDGPGGAINALLPSDY